MCSGPAFSLSVYDTPLSHSSKFIDGVFYAPIYERNLLASNLEVLT